MFKIDLISKVKSFFNPIPTGQGRNQPLYERHLTKSVRDRVNNKYNLFMILGLHKDIIL